MAVRVARAAVRFQSRRYVFSGFLFSLVYRLRNGDVEVVAVAHGRGAGLAIGGRADQRR